MDKINVLIVEDEAITAESLKEVLCQLDYAVSGIASNAFDAIDILNEDRTDIAILDIQIQGEKNGIWIADLIQKKYQIPYLFLTAFADEDTLAKAIKTQPYGYLIKPFSKVDINIAIQLALQNFSKNRRAQPFQQDSIEEHAPTLKLSNAIFIKEGYKYQKIIIESILLIKSDGHYLELYTEKKKHVIRATFKDIIPMLPTALFTRVHRSFLVNLTKIENFGPGFLSISNQKIPISTRYKETLMKKLNIF